MLDHVDYRLAFIFPPSLALLGLRCSGALELPRVRVPLGERPAERLTQMIEMRWRIKSVVLDILEDAESVTACAAIEVRTPFWRFEQEGFCPAHLDAISGASLSEKEHLILLSMLSGKDIGRGPFSRIGWIEETQRWIQQTVCDRKFTFNEDIIQLNAGGGFVLVRFGSEQGPAYWLKAVSEPNNHEFAITTTLAQHFPQYLPPLVAARADWNAWVTEDTGRALREAFSPSSFEQAVRRLAELQKESSVHIDTMLTGGCFDQRLPILRTHLPELICYLEEIMARQTVTTVPVIETRRLYQLERILETACQKMELLGIPDTLIHNDINAGNILFDGTRVVFTDWAETYVGNPFFTFQHLRAQAFLEDRTGKWAPRMTGIYKDHWSSVLSDSQFDRAFALSPPLAIASHIYGRDIAFTSAYRMEPRCQSYARSLARHMDRAAQLPTFLESLYS